jgi:hypothetical protein
VPPEMAVVGRALLIIPDKKLILSSGPLPTDQAPPTEE